MCRCPRQTEPPTPPALALRRTIATRVMRAAVAALMTATLLSPASAAPAEGHKSHSHGAERGTKVPDNGQLAAKIAAAMPKAAPEVWLGTRLRGGDLDRIKVGDQAGLLKVASGDGATDLFLKQDPHISIKALDTVQLARVTPDDRRRILEAMGITDIEVGSVVDAIVRNFEQVPQRPAVALLGVFAAASEREVGATGAAVRAFLARMLLSSRDVSLRRQCVLSLAIAGATDETSVRAVIEFMAQSHNAWETFTTQQFFQYHRDYVRALPSAPVLTDALKATGNPYAPDIVASLKR